MRKITINAAIKSLANKNKLILINLFITIFFFSCKNEEIIYLDFDEVNIHTNVDLASLKKGSSFTLHNEKDTIYLIRLDKKVRTESISTWDDVNFTQIDEALIRLSEITIDNLHIEKKKGIPKIFIARKDDKNGKIKIFEVGQAYPASDHKSGYLIVE